VLSHRLSWFLFLSKLVQTAGSLIVGFISLFFVACIALNCKKCANHICCCILCWFWANANVKTQSGGTWMSYTVWLIVGISFWLFTTCTATNYSKMWISLWNMRYSIFCIHFWEIANLITNVVALVMPHTASWLLANFHCSHSNKLQKVKHKHTCQELIW